MGLNIWNIQFAIWSVAGFFIIAAGCSDGGRVSTLNTPNLVVDRDGDSANPSVDGKDGVGDDGLYLDGVDGGLDNSGWNEVNCEEFPLGYGCPCEGNDECLGGYCVEGLGGFYCTQECLEECPDGWQCKGMSGFGADLVFLCVPDTQQLCFPCQANHQCGSSGVCLGSRESGYCSLTCDESKPCPETFNCTDGVGVNGGAACVPQSGSCSCTLFNEGEQRLCSVSNEFGVCNGYESCDPLVGWVGCSAVGPVEEICDGQDNDCDGSFDEDLPVTQPCINEVEGIGTCSGDAFCVGPDGWVCTASVPTVETCDFKDNDCDGEVDEDYKVNNKYGSLNHCGSCNQDCTGAIANGTSRCSTDNEIPVCVVDECGEGYYSLNEYQCLPVGEMLCKPCASDLACEGGTCVTVGEQSFCSQSCAVGECSESFTCSSIEGVDGKWCVPVSGTCDCSKANAGATRPCSLANGIGTCFGFETCDPEIGWVGCSAAAAAVEICDGIDNDCSGVPDDGLPLSKSCSISEPGIGTCTGTEVCLGKSGWICDAPKPEPEVCDYSDNDCDGEVDEDFIIVGKYFQDANCGTCNNACAVAIPNGTGLCDPSYLVPKCVVADCEDGFFPISPFECIAPPDMTCEQCKNDVDCLGSACVEFDGKKRCALACSDDQECGAETVCAFYEGVGDLCQPVTGSCECDSGNHGAKRSCSVGNEIGTCFGFETCHGEDGWSDCNASLPAAETCDGLDNDCNGLGDDNLPLTTACTRDNEWGSCEGQAVCQGTLGWVCQAQTPAPEICDYADNDCDELVDEIYLVDGKYGSQHHCGSCNKDCDGALPNAAELFCDDGAENPVCKVAQCSDGFFQLNEFQCIEPPDVQCNECQSDGDCYFETCVPVDQGTFCLAPCGDGCGDGYVCESVDGYGDFCVPASGSCECSVASDGAQRGCSEANGAGVCFGFETCLAGAGWQPCDAMIPVDEICDGIDNDCNGQVDDSLPASKPCEKSNEFGTCAGLSLCQGFAGWVCQASTPSIEVCDYTDNDCDGDVDELFIEGGKYVDDDHCGTCNNGCAMAIDHAFGVCDAAYPVPKCVVAQCDEEYFQISPFQCVVPPDTTCQSCTDDSDCIGSSCVMIDGKTRCARECEADLDCSGENSCLPYSGKGLLCQPWSGSCECGTANEGVKRSCSTSNEVGTCFGFQTCSAQVGWGECGALVPTVEFCDGVDNDCNGFIDDGLPVAQPCSQDNEFGSCLGQALCMGNTGWVCQASVPVAEVCDYQDNDCDGEVDEDFVIGGKYGTSDHCGSCNKECGGTLPNALSSCDVGGLNPVCKVDECLEGFYQLNDFQCIEPPDTRCNECLDDGDCYFNVCVPLDQGSYCLTACEEGSCEVGYHCEDKAGSGDICVPDTQSCDCGPSTNGDTRSCTIANDSGTCFGVETCLAESGWSACNALEPTAETCDGIDNNCNGLIDDGLPPVQDCEKSNDWGTCEGIAVCTGTQGWVCQASVPVAEVCDYQDNDCDGQIDETFKVDSKYNGTDHCGTCNNSCESAIENAQAACDNSYLLPKCTVDTCHPGYYQISPFQCVIPPDTTCQACQNDTDCLGGFCVELDGVKRCVRPCNGLEDCAGETVCAELAGLGDVCQPVSGSCECSSFTDGAKRSCSVSNDIGLCYGFATCDSLAGWSGCDALNPANEVCDGIDNDCNGLIDDGLVATMPCSASNDFGVCSGEATCIGIAGWVCQAPEPSAESCDYQDNDCDGEIDEDFRNEDGKYNGFTFCGSCTISCESGFPNATAMCDESKETPQCVVEDCDTGYFLLNEFQCIPNTASLCESCSTDDNCVLDGARCVALDDGNFCSKYCDDEGDCPSGYSCEIYEDTKQCLPLTNSCACDGSNTELSRSCSATWPVEPVPGETFTTCYGNQSCAVDGWSDCVLPGEVCDGIDNDCNGSIDDGFLTDGRYIGDMNCGQCGNNCGFLQFPNAEGVCDGSQTIPDCTMDCELGFHDVNDNPGDGCECEYLGPEDHPDGIDQNCDGVDGELNNGIFVAKDGADNNSGEAGSPMLSIQAAIDMAVGTGRRDVYVATGVYNGSLILKQGVRVYGGYSSDFMTRNALLYETVIFGGQFSEQKPGAVSAFSIAGATATTLLDGFTIFGRNNNYPGSSSYAVYLRDNTAGLKLSNNHIVSGNGGNGLPGSAGLEGVDGSNGIPGDSAFSYFSKNCNVGKVTDGGGGGGQMCGGLDVSGGDGGDSFCPHDGAPDLGENGVVGDGGSGGSGGGAGWDGKFTSSCGLCNVPTEDHVSEGADGVKGTSGVNGEAGQGCQLSEGQVVNGLWTPVGGTNGGGALSGSGGGGGGSGGGADVTKNSLNCNDQIGATGGGAGSGGCSGTGASSGGGAGGSFGIFVTYLVVPPSLPQITDNLVEAGIGGAGGGGGSGGTGGVGGTGATGGAPGTGAAWCSYGGGTGGDGGNGGHGGGGGGGCGGVSYCVYATGTGGLDLTGLQAPANICATGSGGPGGSGGPSIGNPGSQGQQGAGAATNF